MGILLTQGQTRNEIRLDTLKGNKIDNYQIFELSQVEKNQFKDYSKENYPFAKHRNNPSPIYNCHGMSFASRRTNIDRATEIRMIINDDGYDKINIKETLPGDIVLYVKKDDGDIIHSGFLVNCEHPEGNISNIWVVSKWGKFKEVIHHLFDCPYKNCEAEFYRLTHKEYA